MPKGERALRDCIRGDLQTQIGEIWRKGKLYQESQRGDTAQGRSHCKTVERNLSKLIPDSQKEDDSRQISLFILSAAACLHDIGKTVGDDSKGWKSDHGKRSAQIILAQYPQLGVDKGQAIALGHVVGAHGDGMLEGLPNTPVVIGCDEVDVVELAAIFRLADMLDTDCQRAPEILSTIKYPDGNVPSKWRGRQSITGWYMDEKDRIILQSVPKAEETDAAYALKAMMNEDLAKISPHLRYYGYPYELGRLDIGDAFLKLELKKKAATERPFPGMAFYTRNEANIFRGRDKEVDSLLSIVNSKPISLLVGESGAGKTSLIHAGLFPKLETMGWNCVWTRPFDNPRENIKKIVWGAFCEGEVNPKLTLLDVLKKAAENSKSHPILIAMDQFEDALGCPIQSVLDDFSLELMAVQAQTVIPGVRVLIAFREDAFVKLSSRLLKKITGSAQQFPSVELERLTREGAKEALLSGLENAHVGFDPRQEKGEKPLLELILDDLQKDEDRIYPPYVQMVAETLCEQVREKNPIITREIYLEKLKGASSIIANYLIDRLNEFGSLKEKAERTLVFLTSSAGKKAKRSLVELGEGTGIETAELKEILGKMIDLRMARALENDEFEIINDLFGKIVDEKLVKEEDRTIKFLGEQLESYHQSYKVQGNPILSRPFMAILYRNRKRIEVSKEKYPLIVCTALLGEEYGLGWYFLKNVEGSEMHEMIKQNCSHGLPAIRKEALKMLRSMARPEDRELLLGLLRDPDPNVRSAAKEAFAKIAKPEDKKSLLRLIRDSDNNVRSAAREAFVKIAKAEDKELLLKLLRDPSWVASAIRGAFAEMAKPEDKENLLNLFRSPERNVRSAAKEAFAKIAKPEDRELLLKMFRSPDNNVRSAATRAFAKIAKPEDRDLLLGLLRDPDNNVRSASKEAFAKIAKPEDIKLLLGLLCDPNSDVRRTAREAFVMIAKPEDREYLLDFLADQAQGWSEAQASYFELLSELDKKFYCLCQ